MLTREGNVILQQFGEIRMELPESDIAQNLVEKWQKYITENYFKCTDEILSGLGLMYVGDERFTKNIDQYGEGTAEFMSKAINTYCKK